MRRAFPPPLFIHSFVYYVTWIHRFLLYSMGQLLQDLSFCTNCYTWAFSGWPVCLLNMVLSLLAPQQHGYFLAPQDVPGSSVLPCINLPMSPGSSNWRMVFRNQDWWVSHVHITTLNVCSFLWYCGSLILSLSHTRSHPVPPRCSHPFSPLLGPFPLNTQTTWK